MIHCSIELYKIFLLEPLVMEESPKLDNVKIWETGYHKCIKCSIILENT